MNRQALFMRAFAAILFCCTLCNTACVNQIGKETQEGGVPITFCSKIGKTAAKVTYATFNKGDEVGLFALLDPSDIEGKPFLDNLRLVCGDKSTLIPERAVFYPEGDSPLDFISYYPFHPEGKVDGTAIIPVAVENDQSDLLKHSQSDFLIARKTKVKSTAKAVELEYQHKLAKIKIALVPGNDEKVTDMLKANPRIIAAGLKTRANYNLKDDTFSDLSHVADLSAFGKWSMKEGALVGKEIIIVPQEINENDASFTMEWNGKLYNCPFPDLSMESSIEYTINISSTQTGSDVFEGIVSKISDWKAGTDKNTDNQKEYATIHLAALSFTNSNVYRVYNGGRPVAEICKEYLKSEALASRAIVAYPVQDSEKTDLSRGTVLQLLDKEGPVNGGKISWNPDTNSFSYQKGNSAPISQFHLNDKKEILPDKTSDAINVTVVSHTLKDLRGGRLKEYPIVKIGTQYWMGKELHATAYQTGKRLPLQTELGEGAGYFKPGNYDTYFYNGEALLNGKLSPAGWRIPSEEDWNQLKNYTDGSTASLKSGEWKASPAGEVAPADNLTMFDAYPLGMWLEGKQDGVSEMTGFWSWNEKEKKIPAQTVFFVGEKDEFVLKSTIITGENYYKALSIRCIKE